ncbi:MAG: ParB/RepB/Spo0J family partition protein, partial [Leucobacter sp.]|nr:ParB/RepB/Spo0J family partition protein [Leucobacter sp.]
MATKRRGGLGRGIGALIPQTSEGERPVDVFFAGQGAASGTPVVEDAAAPARVKTAKKTSSPATNETELQEVPGATLTHLALSDIIPNRSQPRTEFDEEALEELTHSIREFGVFQPVVVREIAPPPAAGEPRYELIMGERRFRASGRAGLSEIPAIIRSTADEHMLRVALLENLHRAQLNPLEEASAYQQLLADFGITQEQLAERIGRSRPQISNTI